MGKHRERIPDELIDQLLGDYEGPEQLTGPEGLINQLRKRLIERAAGAELGEHLGYPPGGEPDEGQPNRRNGTSSKTLRTVDGPLTVELPRDRDASFEPRIVPKRNVQRRRRRRLTARHTSRRHSAASLVSRAHTMNMEYDNASDDTATKRYRLDATFAHWLAVDPDGLFEILLEVSDGDFDEAERRMALLRFQQSRERLELLPPTTEEAMAMDNKIACLQRGRELLKMITLGDLFVDIKEGELVTRLSPEGVARLF